MDSSDGLIRNKRAPPPISANAAANMNQETKFNVSASFGNAKAFPDKLPGGLVNEGAKPKKKEHIKIANSPECSADVNMFCSDRANSNNFLVLDCLQDNEKTASKLSDSCHHFLWMYKLNLTRDPRFEDASSEACAPELEKFADCKNLNQGEIIPCLIEHYEDIQSKSCSIFLNKMASIIFSDYRFMNYFIKTCNDDITKLKCGRLDSFDDEDDSPHSQGKTVSCLHAHRKELSKPCKKSLQRVAELQSDDFHLDRPLYYACKGDRENLCHDVVAGEGAVFKCLYKHISDDRLSHDCRGKLEDRQQLISEDVKIDKSFYDACKEDIKENDCTIVGHRGDGPLEEDLSRSAILLCLEEAHSEKKNFKPECLQEMFDLRSVLMEDYNVSPELVSACESEIKNFCPMKEVENVLHCLMERIAQTRHKEEDETFGSECKAEVGKLVQVVNPGEDIRLDNPLMRSCGDVISHACSEYHAGQGDIITCLLENLDHEEMSDDCENALLAIQYFAARDFRLDFHLFRQCRNDAVKLCRSSGFSDPATMKPDEGPLIFSCLHRHLRSDNPTDVKPSRPCIHEIKRVMRERSARVNLMPEIEVACLEDLSEHCTDDGEHRKYGGEMDCLQSILEDLAETCRLAVINFTQETSEDVELDRTLMKFCTPMIKRFCNDLLNSDAMPNEVLTCLIEHKNDDRMAPKCAVSIEHRQIISLKDFRFSMKFHEACQDSVSHHCRGKKTKYEVVACLSELVRNDTIRNDGHERVEERCRNQLKFELLQRGETVELDPELKQKCEPEIRDLCQHKRKGAGEVMECLRAHKGKLSDTCYQVAFQREKDDAMFGDYTLLRVCKEMIKKHCPTSSEESDLLRCLIDIKDIDINFDDKCRQVVHHRQVEQTQDVELNPRLQKACRLDIPKFCANVFKDKSSKDARMEGRIIDCLKKNYALKKKDLSADCSREVQFLIREAAMDISLNPLLLKTCMTDIKEFCADKIADLKADQNGGDDVITAFGSGSITECLKSHFKKLKDPKCKEEVAYVVAESRIDVHVDPLLQAACQQDLVSHCVNIVAGQGRQMACLLTSLERNPKSLTLECKNILQGRKELWESAAQVAPAESFSEILNQMSSSPARNYFFAILFTVIGIIFIVGLTCGRVTKRVRAEIKNK
ncbi:hypothetical protein BsWGS_15830 [Bradybaena similaris]